MVQIQRVQPKNIDEKPKRNPKSKFATAKIVLEQIGLEKGLCIQKGKSSQPFRKLITGTIVHFGLPLFLFTFYELYNGVQLDRHGPILFHRQAANFRVNCVEHGGN